MALSFCGKRLVLKRISSLTLAKRHGYIVLVPEIGEDLPDKNPLLQKNGLPEFSSLTIENCMAAIGKQTLDIETGVQNMEDRILQQPIKDIFQDVLDPLENLGSSLDTTWGISKTLYLGNSSLMPTKSYLAIHDRARRARGAKFQSPPIYNIIKTSLNEGPNRNEEETRVMKKFELEGKLNGLDISRKDKAKLDEVLNKLSIEKSNFKAKTDVATKLFKHQITDPQIVRDFPINLLKAISINPAKPQEGPWFASLQSHIYLPFMQYCPERELRWNLWQAMVGRGSTYDNNNFATSTHLEEIRFLRREQANLLGYKNFAEMSMETKMAGSVQNIKNLVGTLLHEAVPAQERELLNLYEFAVHGGFKGERIELWDAPYWRRKHQLSLFQYNEEEFRNYFPFPKVLEGLFKLCERLFKITIKQRSDVSTWAKDVKYFDILEPHSSAPVSGFYLDPYVRTDDKLRIPHNGWMVGIQNRSLVADTKPLAALVFNFEPPTNDKPSLLSFKEVNLLFHKFGHALQHLLTRTSYSEVSGLSNVEWDVVEVGGHVLANWLYNQSVIDSIASHCDSGNKLPNDMFETLVNMRKHMAGVDLCRELYLSALDLELHSSKDFWLDIVRRLWPQYRSFPLGKNDAHPCSFTQIFVDEWAAAYYSHVWARVIAADVYGAFHEVQDNEEIVKEVGKRYRDTFLALGGSCDPSEVFRKFRGRDPSPNALLSSLDLKQAKRVQAK